MNLYESVKAAVTARQAAERCGLAVSPGGMANCPFHDDKHPSLKLDERYFCFGCGAQGDAVDFTARFFNLTPKDAALRLAADFGVPITEHTAKGLPDRKPLFHARTRPEDAAILTLLQYLHLLRRWRSEYAPRTMNELWDPRFVEALQREARVEYLLDTLLDAGKTERADLVTACGKEISAIDTLLRNENARVAGGQTHQRDRVL